MNRRIESLNAALFYHKEIVGRPLMISVEKREEFPAVSIDEVLATARAISDFLALDDGKLAAVDSEANQ